MIKTSIKLIVAASLCISFASSVYGEKIVKEGKWLPIGQPAQVNMICWQTYACQANPGFYPNTPKAITKSVSQRGVCTASPNNARQCLCNTAPPEDKCEVTFEAPE